MKVILTTLNAKYIHSSLALPYLKLYCQDDGYHIDIMEFTINEKLDDIMARLYLAQPDVIAFSCYIWNIEPTLLLCQDLKKLLPQCIFILGGPEVSFNAPDLMVKNEFIHVVVKGEGEETLKELLQHIHHGKSLNSVQGICWRDQTGIIDNQDRELIRDLDAIPSPYQGDLTPYKGRLVYYESSRGCPFNCSYCLSSTLRGVRVFSMDRVKRDLSKLIHSGAETIKFVDRTFNCNEKRAREIMQFILDQNSGTRFHFEICADLLSDDFMSFLQTVPPNIFAFEIGIQSTYPAALQAINRNCDMERFKSNVQQLAGWGNIHLHLDLIAGLPMEGYTCFKQSFNDVYNLHPDVIQLGFLKLLKGSPLQDNITPYGYIFQEGPPYQVLSNDYLSYPEIIRLNHVESLLERFYNSGEFRHSLSYITETIYYGDAFSLFEDMALFWEQNEWFYLGHGRRDEYNMLMQFMHDNHLEHYKTINEYLKYDYILNNRHNPLPEKIERHYPEKAQNNLYELLKDREFIDKKLGEWSQLSKYELSKRVHLEYFTVDPAEIQKVSDAILPILFVYPANQRKASRVILV